MGPSPYKPLSFNTTSETQTHTHTQTHTQRQTEEAQTHKKKPTNNSPQIQYKIIKENQKHAYISIFHSTIQTHQPSFKTFMVHILKTVSIGKYGS